MYKENFAPRLKTIRIEIGMTQKEVADEIKIITQSQLSRMEKGKIEPNLEQLATIAQYYNISINWLLGVSIE